MPLAIDLFAGLGGWSEALLDHGYDVVGFDIERHIYGEHHYPAQLVIQDVLTLHGSQFRDAALIIASPPCQFFSYCAMPWSRAKKLGAEVRADPVRLEKELALFKACFRIQREACEAAGHHIPLIVENVRGAQPWVGRARWNYGSFYLWGDVPALMPPTFSRKLKGGDRNIARANGGHKWNQPEDRIDGLKVAGFRFDGNGGSFQTASVVSMARQIAPSLEGFDYKRTADDKRQHLGAARKAASALIAKIPQPLAQWIARTYR